MDFKTLKKIFPMIFMFGLMSIVSAQWRSYYSSPTAFLENEWIKFALIFALFFAIVFVAVHRSFRENKGAAAVVAIAVSGFISMAVAQRGWLYSYAGEGIGSWALVFALLIGLGFIIKLMLEVFGRWGGMITAIVLWLLLFYIDPYEIIPYGEFGELILTFYEYATGILGFLALIVIIALIWKFAKKEKGFRIIPGEK